MMNNWGLLYRVSVTVSIVVVLVSLGVPAIAQSYSFEATTGTFTSIRDTGTRLDLSSRDPDADNGVFNEVGSNPGTNRGDLQFDFFLFGQLVRSVAPTTNLFLTTNSSFRCEEANCRTVAPENLNNAESDLDLQGALFPFWTDASFDLDTGGVYWDRTGREGEQVFTVEFSRFSLTDTPSHDTISAQVKLYEADGTVEFIYERGADSGSLGDNSRRFAVGLAASSDFLSSSSSQYYTYDGTSSTSDFNRRDVTSENLFDTGTILRFTPNDYPLLPPHDLVVIRGVHISRILPPLPPNPNRQRVSYFLSGISATGLVFNADSRTLSGTVPRATFDRRPITYEAIERLPVADGVVNDIRHRRVFYLSVVDDVANEATAFASGESIPRVRAGLNVPLREIGMPQRFPAPVSGNEPFYYTTTPALPAGITLNPYTRELSGSPTELVGLTTYTYTAADLDEQTDTLTFQLSVEDASVSIPSINDIAVQVRDEISPAITLPVATGGLPPNDYTYSISPALPDGIVFDPESRELSGEFLGTAVNDTETLRFTYRVVDSHNQRFDQPFNINIVDSVPSYDPELVRQITLFPGNSITLDLPDSDNGTVPISEFTSVGSTAPQRLLDYRRDSRVFIITVPPDTPGPNETFQFAIIRTATDADGDVAIYTLTINIVDDGPVAPLVGDLPLTREGVLEVTVNDPIELVVLPAFGYAPETSNPPPLTYTLTPRPPGLVFNSDRMISGTPNTVGDTLTTYTATDNFGDSDSVSFTIRVLPDAMPERPTVARNYNFFPGVEVRLQLPPFMHEDGASVLTHRLERTDNLGTEVTTLIGDLDFDPQTRIISGTPAGTDGNDGVDATSYTYYAIDSDPRPMFADEESVTFTITIVDDMPDFGTTDIENIVTIQGILLEPVNLPVVTTVGTVRSVYSLSPTPPLGINYNPEQRTLGGTPSGASPRTLYTYTVTDLDGDTDTITFYITAEEDTQPQAPSAPQAYTYTPGESVTTQLLDFTEGNTPLMYTLMNESGLPTGLDFTAASRTIEGMIPADSPSDDSFEQAPFTYTATDQNDDSASATFTIEVIDDRPVAPRVSNHSLAVDEPILAITLDPFTYIPTTSSPELTYTLAPLPNGLVFDRDNLRITGRPDTEGDTTVVYSAMDDTDIAQVSFTISITDDPKPVAPTIDDQEFIPGQTVSLVLDPFVISDGSMLTHELYRTDDPTMAPATTLIAGLEFDLASLLVSGMVAATNGDDTVEPTSYTYSATDSDDRLADTTRTTFTLAVVDEMPDFSDFDAEPIRDLVFIQNFDIGSRQFPLTTGTGTVQYVIAPALPQGLDFDYDAGVLTGAAEMEQVATDYTYTATDSDMDTAMLSFSITVVEDLPVVAPPEQEFEVRVGESNRFTLAAFTGGNGMLTYALVGSLPSQLMLNPDTRVVSGRVTGTSADDEDLGVSFTYTATDEDGSTASATFILDILDPRPEAPGVQMFEFAPDEEISVTVAAFVGGSGDLTYLQPSPPLPNWLTFNTDNLMLTGTAPADTSANDYFEMTYTYTATDADLDLGSHSFTVKVIDDRPSAPRVDAITLAINDRVSTITLPRFTYIPDTSTPQLTYTLAPLPAGLDFDPAKREITGMPNVIGQTAVVYAATDGTDTDQVTFTITVTGDPFPVAPTVLPLFFVPGQSVNVRLSPFTISDSTTLTYSMARADDPDRNPITSLVAGLSFNPNTRIISGTVAATTGNDSVPATYFVYSATDSDARFRDTTSVTFSITIRDLRPNFGSAQIPDIITSQGSDLTPMTLPQTYGTGTVTYTITPNLPQGLSFNTDTRELAGTLGAEQAAITYTYTATDSDGDTATLNFDIRVTGLRLADTTEEDDRDPDPPLVPPTQEQAFSFIPGQDVSETLEPFTGGFRANLGDDLTYALVPTPALPAGLGFTPNTRLISGTLPADMAGDDSFEMTYIYTATDGNNNSAMTTFTITIVDTLIAPRITNFFFTVGELIDPTELPTFIDADSTTAYTLEPVPTGLTFTAATRMLTGTPTVLGRTTVTYTATDAAGDTAAVEFDIVVINDVPTLQDATANAMPYLIANIATVSTQAISSRVERALNGLSEGVEIQTLDGRRFNLTSNLNQAGRDGFSDSFGLRLGIWYSVASDSLSDSGSTLQWDATTDTTNIGLDVVLDLTPQSTLVAGVMQNSTSTSATYGSSTTDGRGTLAVDFDTTAYYMAFGTEIFDIWFANGSGTSTLIDSARFGEIPAGIGYRTLGITYAFELVDKFRFGVKVEKLRSDLSLLATPELNYLGLETVSSQVRAALVANYQITVGESGNGQLKPQFDLGLRDLGFESSLDLAASTLGGTAMEFGFGIDYLQKRWGLRLGIDYRAIAVGNYSADSIHWQLQWESGSYGKGFSLRLTPHAAAETLGGADALFSGSYDQFQSLLGRQFGGDENSDGTDGLDFEMGFGIVANYGTLIPYVRASNISNRDVLSRSDTSQSREMGLRYLTPTQFSFEVVLERTLTPQTFDPSLSSLLNAFGISVSPLKMREENSLTLATRYSF